MTVRVTDVMTDVVYHTTDTLAMIGDEDEN